MVKNKHITYLVILGKSMNKNKLMILNKKIGMEIK